MKITDIILEAANPTHQAAIAIAMKKAGKKPRSESVTEMDKSQTPPGRDGGDSDAGKKEHTATPTTAKKAVKDAEKMLNKELNKKQGVAEGSEADAYGNTGEKHECGSCDGTGIVSYDEYDDVCPECGGKGWVRDKESLKKKGMAEHTELAEEFDLIESIVEMIAEHNGVDAEVVWEDLESLTEDELYVFAVTSDPLMEDWQKANKRDKTDGMSQKAVNAYRREHPGSKLKTAVTTKPSKLKKGSKASKRRKSYCSRSRGQMKMHSISCAKTPDKAICKARRRWNC